MTKWDAVLHWETLAPSRGKSVMSQMIEHRPGSVCGRTSLDFARSMFDWWRQTSPKVWWNHKAGRNKNMGLEFPLRLVVSVSRSWCCTVEKVQPGHLTSGYQRPNSCIYGNCHLIVVLDFENMLKVNRDGGLIIWEVSNEWRLLDCSRKVGLRRILERFWSQAMLKSEILTVIFSGWWLVTIFDLQGPL